MKHQVFEYPLVDGWIHNWLAAGLQPVEEQAFDAGLFLAEQPVERGPFSAAGLTWRYWQCQEDHAVDLSEVRGDHRAVAGWAYVELQMETPEPVTLALSASSQAEIWLNGQRVLDVGAEGMDGAKKQTARTTVLLQAENQLMLRMVAEGQAARLAAAVQVEADDGVLSRITVHVPTRARYPHRQAQLEKAFAWAYLEEVTNHRGASFNLRFAPGAALPEGENVHYSYQVQDAQGRTYVDGNGDLRTTDSLDVGHTVRLNERPYRVVLRAPGKEYYEQNLRYQVDLPITVLDNAYSTRPYGTYESRRAEILQDAARRDGSVYYQAARMVVEKWDEVSRQEILAALDGDDLERLGGLGVLYRFGQDARFPVDLAEEMHAKLAGWKLSAATEAPSSAMLRETTALLAAQLRTDAEEQAAREQALKAMLHDFGQRGFVEWDSDPAYERLVVALAHLISFAQADWLRDLSAVVLDKVLFLTAINSFQGVLGGSRGCTLPGAARSGQLSATAGIARLLYGMGVFTARAAGAVSLALSEYEFPSFFAEMAQAETPQASRERHGGAQEEVNIVSYRTGDYLLSSAQDDRPGQVDACGLAWGAVLGADTLVYTSAPASFRIDEQAQPGFWAGSASRPRVAQWNDSLVAVYHLPQDSWIDFTHAFFPTPSFDEWNLAGNWAFARKGTAYLALTAAQPLELVQRRPDAMRELRSYGRDNVWVCQMGSTAEDGDFAGFCARVQGSPLSFIEPGVTYTSLRGAALAFGWQGAFTVDGQNVDLAQFPHIDHPYGKAEYPAQALDVNFRDILLRLDFA